ncbi:MAG: hypothetical protein D6814_03945, partial [Calditrichaeota bacterium]
MLKIKKSWIVGLYWLLAIALGSGVVGCKKQQEQEKMQSAAVGTFETNTATHEPRAEQSTAASTTASVHESRETAITRAVKQVSDAVVGINVLSIREYRRSIFDYDPFFRQFFPSIPY